MISEIYIHPTSFSPHEKKKKEINRRSIRNQPDVNPHPITFRDATPSIQGSNDLIFLIDIGSFTGHLAPVIFIFHSARED